MLRRPESPSLFSPRSKACSNEGGQIIVMVALAAFVLIAVVGLAVDIGRLYITKAELSRSVDAAALAGVAELNGKSDQVTRACEKATAYFNQNEGGADASLTGCYSPGQNELRIEGSKSVQLYFLDMIPTVSHSVGVDAHAVANYGVQTQPVDAVMLLDATGSMSGNKIDQAKIAAGDFKTELLGGTNGSVQVGISPFRGCFRSTSPASISPKYSSQSYCANYDSQVKYLTSNSSEIQSVINNVDAQGGSGTNVCGALFMGADILNGPGNQIGKDNYSGYLILLSDGNNIYNAYSYQSYNPVSPYASCTPSYNPSNSDPNTGTGCYSGQTRSTQLDALTLQEAETIKASGIKIYVVGFEVCGTDNGATFTQAQCDSQVGNGDSDNTADRRLLKCVASSKSGTNDHYWETSDASELPGIFQTIAKQIGDLHLID